MNAILIVLHLSLVVGQFSYCFSYNPLQEKVNSGVKEILSKWENKELELSVGCAQQLYQFLGNLIYMDDGLWALKMIDACGKLPSGLAEGNFQMMGNYDECLKIESTKTNVTGNYCSITLDLSQFDLVDWDRTKKDVPGFKKYQEMINADIDLPIPIATVPILGICLPNKCSEKEIKHSLEVVTTFVPLSIKCQTKEDISPPLDTGAVVTISVFGVIIFLMMSSTIYDCISKRNRTETNKLLIAFSIYTNGSKLFTMRGQGELGCLHGIRFLSMCWVILGHVFMCLFLGPTSNLFDVLEYMNKTSTMLYLNCAHAVDSFFVLSGLLVSYNFMKKMKKVEKINIFQYYLHRYLRLTPAYAAIILCTVFLIKYLGSGPFYYMMDSIMARVCRDHWWKALIYFQNYLTDNADMCIGQSWNLSVDWQLYLISPLILFLLYKSPKVGTLIITLLIIGCMAAGFAITYQKHLESVLFYGNSVRFNVYYYQNTHTRAATWFIGAWVGYVLGRINFYNDKTYLKMPKWLVIVNWLVVLTVVPICIFAGHDTLLGSDYDVMANSSYNAFVRPAWALCVSWIIFACTTGYGGLINTFLSLPIFGVLSRFTYSMYLIHLNILFMTIFSAKTPLYFSTIEMIRQFCFVFAISFILAIFWILAFEMPILVVEPYLFNWNKLTASKNVKKTGTSTVINQKL